MTHLGSPTQPPVFKNAYRIYLEDTDAGGIVYHANHLKLFERCRRDWLRNLGMSSYFYQAHSAKSPPNEYLVSPDIQFVVSQANVSYHHPILLDDEVTVTVSAVTCKAASLQLDQRIYGTATNDKQSTVLLSQAAIELVCVRTAKNAAGHTQVRPTRLPQAFVTLLQAAT